MFLSWWTEDFYPSKKKDGNILSALGLQTEDGGFQVFLQFVTMQFLTCISEITCLGMQLMLFTALIYWVCFFIHWCYISLNVSSVSVGIWYLFKYIGCYNLTDSCFCVFILQKQLRFPSSVCWRHSVWWLTNLRLQAALWNLGIFYQKSFAISSFPPSVPSTSPLPLLLTWTDSSQPLPYHYVPKLMALCFWIYSKINCFLLLSE